MEVITSQTPVVTAAENLNKLLASCTLQPTLLMLSGGSAIAILEYVDVSLLGPHVTITTLDERFSTDQSVSNFAQIIATDFYQQVTARGVMAISTLVRASDTLSGAGERFTTALHGWREAHQDGVVIALMGVGSDGHTAGIFPHQPNLNPATTDWVVAYEVSAEVSRYTMRITTTPLFLKTEVAHAICFITGEEKRSVLEHIQDVDCTPTDMPACIVKDMSSVTLITDIS